MQPHTCFLYKSDAKVLHFSEIAKYFGKYLAIYHIILDFCHVIHEANTIITC